MSIQNTFTIQQQLEVVKREIHMRERVYPRLVSEGKMTGERAEYELGCMEEVFVTLKKLKVAEEDKCSLFSN